MHTTRFWNNLHLVHSKNKKTKKYRTVESVPTSNGNIAEREDISIPLTNINMTADIPGLVQALCTIKSGEDKLVLLV